MVWFIMIWLILVVIYGLEVDPGNSHQSSSDPGLVRVRPTLGHRFAYDTVRSEQHGDFKLPFSWDEGDGTGEPRLLAGSSEASKASTSVEQNHKGSPRTAVGHSSEKSLRLRVVQHGGKDQKLFVKDTRRSARVLIPMFTSTE